MWIGRRRPEASKVKPFSIYPVLARLNRESRPMFETEVSRNPEYPECLLKKKKPKPWSA